MPSGTGTLARGLVLPLALLGSDAFLPVPKTGSSSSLARRLPGRRAGERGRHVLQASIDTDSKTAKARQDAAQLLSDAVDGAEAIPTEVIDTVAASAPLTHGRKKWSQGPVPYSDIVLGE